VTYSWSWTGVATASASLLSALAGRSLTLPGSTTAPTLVIPANTLPADSLFSFILTARVVPLTGDMNVASALSASPLVATLNYTVLVSSPSSSTSSVTSLDDRIIVAEVLTGRL